MLWLDGV